MPFNSTNMVETFESDGPRKLYFQPDGTPYMPGDFLADRRHHAPEAGHHGG